MLVQDGISIAIGISSVATFATFIGIPVSAALGAASMTGAISSGIISVLTKRYQKKLKKVMCLIDMVTPARLKVVRPLRTKQAHDVAEMIADIYKVGPLKYPQIFQCDNGSEFKLRFWKRMKLKFHE